MTCASASECWAVGSYVNGTTYQTLTERWDGTSWAIVTSPNTSTSQTNILSGVTCVSAAADCWAIGYYFTGSVYQTLIERWDGTSWAIVTSPNTATQSNVLNDVTCVSASNCWAVGYDDANGPFETLIERWDGTAWAIVSSPNTSDTQHNHLVGVTCVSASECWAVGYYEVGLVAQTLIERYPAISPLTPTSVVSRKTHGKVGTFDIDLPLIGNPGIECRTGGTNNDYQVLVTFARAVTFNTAAVTSGTGTISSATGSGTPVITVNLTGVTNAQTITLTLSGVNDGTKTGDVGVRMGVLIGDVNASGTVSNADVASIQTQVGATVTQSNFRNDVNANGTLSNGDVAAAQAQVGTQLP